MLRLNRDLRAIDILDRDDYTADSGSKPVFYALR